MSEVVVGIDFGSSGSGFAYAYTDNKEEIIHGMIPGANVDNKVPTEIILDDNDETIKFGADCVKFIKEKGFNVGHYFKEIKMNLYEKKTSIAAKNSGKIVSLEKVIQRVLEKIRDLAITEIQKNRPTIIFSEIKWVVTVPAIWGEFEKNIMMEACIKAKLISEDADKSLFFALEPEAASCYCSKNKSIDQKYLKQGNCYIICDLGGGTGDIVTHLVGNNCNLNEVSPASGGKFGSDEINKNIFEELVFTIFDCKDFNSYYKKYKELNQNGEEEKSLFIEWCELEREIKDLKEGTDNEKVKNNEVYPIRFSMFQDIFDENIDINILVNKYNKYCDKELKLKVSSKRKWNIDIPYKLIYNYIKKQVNSICEIINKILKNSDENINSMILVGGYILNEVLLSEIKKELSNKISHFLIPSKPCLSIMEGAVLFGLNPNKIIQRKAKYTFGMKYIDIDFINGLKDNCFSVFIKINQNLQLGQEIVNDFFMLSPRYCNLKFYKTLKPDPIYIDEEGVEQIGECRLDAGEDYPFGKRDITVTMRFGGTFIDVKAKHKISGNKVNTKLEFY